MEPFYKLLNKQETEKTQFVYIFYEVISVLLDP